MAIKDRWYMVEIDVNAIYKHLKYLEKTTIDLGDAFVNLLHKYCKEMQFDLKVPPPILILAVSNMATDEWGKMLG